MKKEFNVTGTCYPDTHYMMDFSAKLNACMEMVEGGKYFVINRPRQYGKTTTLYHLTKGMQHSEKYLPIHLNFQGIDSKWHVSDAAFAQMFLNLLIRDFKFSAHELSEFLIKNQEIEDMDSLSGLITDLVHQSSRQLVLLIDEVDASSNYLSFLSFLNMLRTKFLARRTPQHATFHSVILAGVHDIKSLKYNPDSYRDRNPEDAKNNSPWNIASNFDVEMSFNPKEIAPMLEEYSKLEKVDMNVSEIAERLYFHTAGYPFLVSKLCEIFAEKILPKKTENPTPDNYRDRGWTIQNVDEAAMLILREDNPNFDSLIQHLKNHEDLYNLVFRMIINGETISMNLDNSTIQKGVTYGVFKLNGQLKINNRIYEQRIYNFLASNLETTAPIEMMQYPHRFHLPNNELDLEKLLEKFQQFLKEQYSSIDEKFLERQWRLIFLAFLQPVLNGNGYAFKESQVSEERRLDVVLTYHQHRYIIELKKWYGASYHQKGLTQLADYLDIHGIQNGYLIIFDGTRKVVGRVEAIEHQGKEIFAVWV